MKGVLIRDFERPPQGALDELTGSGSLPSTRRPGGPG